MNRSLRQSGFTLVELLIVVSIIALLTSIVVPSLAGAREFGRSGKCLATLNALGRTMGQYHAENNESFWPTATRNHPRSGVTTYFWGTNTIPVETDTSPLLAYCERNLAYLQCPSQPWGSYVPQGGVNEPTTNYGYNAWCLDPPAWGRRENGQPMPTKRSIQLPKTSELFVFADSGMYWAPAGVAIFQNSTHLEPVSGPWVSQPTTHFRHRDRTNALCADAHAAPFELEGGTMPHADKKLGFVGKSNVPHYDIKDY